VANRKNVEKGRVHSVATRPGLVSTRSRAQGLPVETGSHLPVALWFIGAAVLGLVLAYGIMRNRSRTRAEKHITDQATKKAYAQENRDRVSH
jgi:hypothetical protein